MFLSLRTLSIVFLVLLQFIAPLVHAHTGEKLFNRGLHVPGLESYSRAQESAAKKAILQLSSYQIDSEGVLISIDTGLKVKQTADDTDSPVFITPTPIVVKATLSPYDANFSPQSQPVVAQFLTSAHPVRAPPEHSSFD